MINILYSGCGILPSLSISESVFEYWCRHNLLVWGIGPVLAYIIGYLLTAAPLEILIRSNCIDENRFIKHSGKSRTEKLKANNLSKQLPQIFYVVFGPTAIVNGVIGAFLVPWTNPSLNYSYLPSYFDLLTQFIVMEFVGDFFLYWGHRLQHEIPFLWERFHRLHHTLDTPTPLGTLYIDSMDATLQGALPMLLAAIAARPHPLSFYIYIFARISENVVNHSGLNHPLTNMLYLKFLPGRASIAHHDSHHLYSNYAKGAKNYGENFFLWDKLFGTFREVEIRTKD